MTRVFLSFLMYLTLQVCEYGFCTHANTDNNLENKSPEIFYNSQSIEFLWDKRPASVLFEFMGNYFIGFESDKGAKTSQDKSLPQGIISIEKNDDFADESGKKFSFYKVETTPDVIPILKIEANSWHLVVRGKNAPPQIRDNQSLGILYGDRGYTRVEPIFDTDYNSFISYKNDEEKFFIHFSPRIDLGLKANESELMETCYSSQGFAFRLKTDKIFFSKSQQSIIASLPLIPPLENNQNIKHKSILTADDSLFALPKEDINWQEYEEFLVDKINSTDENKRVPLQLELAWVKLCRGRGASALNDLRYIRTISPLSKSLNVYKLFLGLGYLLNDQYEEALEQFNNLTKTPEVLYFSLICRGYIDSKYLDIDKNILKVLNFYPEELRSRLIIKTLNLMDKFNQYELLEPLVGNINKRPKSKSMAAYFDFYRSLYLIEQRSMDEGIIILQDLIRVDQETTVPNEVRALATYELFKAKVNKLSDEEAVKELEAMRFIARGKDIEIKVLIDIVDLYVKLGNFRQALKILHDTITIFPKRAEAYFLRDKMYRVYSKFFASDLTSISPIQIIGLYQRYNFLIPAEKEQEILIINIVAEMLERVDLIKSAAELLTKSLNIITEQWKKDKLYLKIAKLYNMVKDANSAITVLDQFDKIPDNMSEDYSLLRSKALSIKKEYIQALDVLEKIETEKTLRAAADISIDDMHNFSKAEGYLRKLLELFESNDKVDRAKKEDAILDYAAVIYLNENKKALVNLWVSYADYMKDGETNFKLFKFLVQRDWQFTSAEKMEEFLDGSTKMIQEIIKRRESVASLGELLNPGL